MLQREHSAILLTCIKLPLCIKTFVLSIFKWLLKKGFTVYQVNITNMNKMLHMYILLYQIIKILFTLFQLLQPTRDIHIFCIIFRVNKA